MKNLKSGLMALLLTVGLFAAAPAFAGGAVVNAGSQAAPVVLQTTTQAPASQATGQTPVQLQKKDPAPANCPAAGGNQRLKVPSVMGTW